jgi:hypothetical protein
MNGLHNLVPYLMMATAGTLIAVIVLRYFPEPEQRSSQVLRIRRQLVDAVSSGHLHHGDPDVQALIEWCDAGLIDDHLGTIPPQDPTLDRTPFEAWILDTLRCKAESIQDTRKGPEPRWSSLRVHMDIFGLVITVVRSLQMVTARLIRPAAQTRPGWLRWTSPRTVRVHADEHRSLTRIGA